MRGSVPRCIAYDRRERSADGAFFAADADVRESAPRADSRTDEHAQVIGLYKYY